MPPKKPRVKPPDAIALIVRPLPPSQWFPNGEVGLATYNGDSYLIEYNASLDADGRLLIRGYRLRKAVPDLVEPGVYDLEPDLKVCFCQGSLRWADTGTVCRHRKILKHCLETGGLL